MEREGEVEGQRERERRGCFRGECLFSTSMIPIDAAHFVQVVSAVGEAFSLNSTHYSRTIIGILHVHHTKDTDFI